MEEKKVSKNVFENIIIAICIMAYFIFINFTYNRVSKENVIIMLKIFSMIILSFAIILLEISYRKDNGKIAINSIEVMLLAAHTLSIVHVVEFQKFNFAIYILVSSYIFSIYYLFKSLFIYTKEKRDYLNSLSDIKEIVANEPVKKEAMKRGENKK